MIQKEENGSINEILIENFTELQKAITNLSLNFNELSKEMSTLLGVFELAAKTEIEQKQSPEQNIEIIEKLNYLIGQNKSLAQAVLILEERTRKPTYKELPRRAIESSLNVRPSMQMSPISSLNPEQEKDSSKKRFLPRI
jgi:Ser-tRNA(Ala) deacylase AlaX